MKFQEVTNKFPGLRPYQAQFYDKKSIKQALEWLSDHSHTDVDSDHYSIYISDLQVIFELRLQFDQDLRVIRKSVPSQSGKS